MSETRLVKTKSKNIITDLVFVSLVIILGIAIRWILILIDKVPFNSDEAIVGLMARHILAGEHPIFFYGQSYMGSLDTYFVAGAFLIFGKTVNAIRISQSFLFCIFLLLSYQFSCRLFNSKRAALITIIFLAAAPVNFLLYTTVTLGGYLEALIIGVAILWCTLELQKILTGNNTNQKMVYALCLILGGLIGLGVWVLGITIVFSVSVLIILLPTIIKLHPSKQTILGIGAMVGCGLIIGAAPIWVYMTNHGAATFLNELFGSAVSVSQSYLAQVGLHLANLLLFGVSTIFGLRPPWEVRWLLLPLIPFVLGAWAFILWKAFKYTHEDEPKYWIYLWSPSILLIIAFILTPFGIDPSGRYFLPVYFSLALTAGLWFIHTDTSRTVMKWAITGIIVLFNLGGILQASIQSPFGITTQFAPNTSIDHRYDKELIAFLMGTSNFQGYSTYWTAYPIAFLSDEKVILIPALPYHADLRHTTRDDRYEPYATTVTNSQDPIYITSNNPNLDVQIVKEFNQIGIKWSEKVIGDYRIYYDLSRKVLPQEIGFGINRP